MSEDLESTHSPASDIEKDILIEGLNDYVDVYAVVHMIEWSNPSSNWFTINSAIGVLCVLVEFDLMEPGRLEGADFVPSGGSAAEKVWTVVRSCRRYVGSSLPESPGPLWLRNTILGDEIARMLEAGTLSCVPWGEMPGPLQSPEWRV